MIESLGRFISEDPLKGSMISPQSQNPYVYYMNNPLRVVDPSGMDSADSTYEDIRFDNSSSDLYLYGYDSYGNAHYATQSVVDNWIQEAIRGDLSGHPPGSYVPSCAMYGSGGVSVTVTSQSYAESGKRSGAPNYQPPMGDPRFTNPARNAKPVDAIIIGVEGAGGWGPAGELGKAVVISKSGVEYYYYSGKGILLSKTPSGGGKIYVGIIEGNTNLEGKSFAGSVTLNPSIAGIDISGSVSPSLDTIIGTIGLNIGVKGYSVMGTVQNWTRYVPTGDTTPNTCTM